MKDENSIDQGQPAFRLTYEFSNGRIVQFPREIGCWQALAAGPIIAFRTSTVTIPVDSMAERDGVGFVPTHQGAAQSLEISLRQHIAA